VPGKGRLKALPGGDPGQGWLPTNVCQVRGVELKPNVAYFASRRQFCTN